VITINISSQQPKFAPF